MRAGLLRGRWTIQEMSPATQNSLGEETSPWSTVATVWMAVSPLSGREFFAAQATQSEVTHMATMRYRAGIIPKMRLTKGPRVLDIQSVADLDERHRELQLLCVER